MLERESRRSSVRVARLKCFLGRVTIVMAVNAELLLMVVLTICGMAGRMDFPNLKPRHVMSTLHGSSCTMTGISASTCSDSLRPNDKTDRYDVFVSASTVRGSRISQL